MVDNGDEDNGQHFEAKWSQLIQEKTLEEGNVQLPFISRGEIQAGREEA